MSATEDFIHEEMNRLSDLSVVVFVEDNLSSWIYLEALLVLRGGATPELERLETLKPLVGETPLLGFHIDQKFLSCRGEGFLDGH